MLSCSNALREPKRNERKRCNRSEVAVAVILGFFFLVCLTGTTFRRRKQCVKSGPEDWDRLHTVPLSAAVKPVNGIIQVLC